MRFGATFALLCLAITPPIDTGPILYSKLTLNKSKFCVAYKCNSDQWSLNSLNTNALVVHEEQVSVKFSKRDLNYGFYTSNNSIILEKNSKGITIGGRIYFREGSFYDELFDDEWELLYKFLNVTLGASHSWPGWGKKDAFFDKMIVARNDLIRDPSTKRTRITYGYLNGKPYSLWWHFIPIQTKYTHRIALVVRNNTTW